MFTICQATRVHIKVPVYLLVLKFRFINRHGCVLKSIMLNERLQVSTTDCFNTHHSEFSSSQIEHYFSCVPIYN